LTANRYEVIDSADPGIVWIKLIAQEKMPDLILCSYPQDGLAEFLQKKHREKTTRSIPIIFLMKEEVKSNREELERGPKHNYWYYTPIPFNPLSLLKKIDEIMALATR